jgi:hypothetical protein
LILSPPSSLLCSLFSLLPPQAAQSYFSLLFSFLFLHSSNCQAVPGFNSLTLFFSFDGLSSKEERALKRGETRRWAWREQREWRNWGYSMELLKDPL